MKEKFLAISEKVKNDEIDLAEARKQICELFGMKHKPKVVGRALVKAPEGSQPFIYEGHEVRVTGVYMVHKDEDIIDYDVSLEGTPFVESHGYSATVLPSTHLKFIERHEL